ncbi:hypothetical protein FRC12_003899 [Ceratobasidium sp. 428]|nr:hypothetical protein FRC12_003899 [Ceratobasidium sp. 428]
MHPQRTEERSTSNKTYNVYLPLLPKGEGNRDPGGILKCAQTRLARKRGKRLNDGEPDQASSASGSTGENSWTGRTGRGTDVPGVEQKAGAVVARNAFEGEDKDTRGQGEGEVRFEEEVTNKSSDAEAGSGSKGEGSGGKEENLAQEDVLRPNTTEPAATVDSWSEARLDDDASQPSAEVGVA